MNDFLKSLRSNNKDKQYDRNDRNDRPNRRQYGSNNYGNSSYNGNPQYNNPQYKNDRNNGNLRKPYRPVDNSKLSILMEEAFPEIKEFISRLTDAGERFAAAEERKASAMERLSESLGALLTNNALAVTQNGFPVAGHQAMDAGNAMNTVQKPVNNMAREAVLDIILTMRDEGATYGKIADYLEEENIPTFSRKGKWHAQTIHRVCRECA